MPEATNHPKKPAPAHLVNDCLNHLIAERELLERFVGLSSKIHDSLGKSIFPAEDSNDSESMKLASDAEEIVQSRGRVVSEIASFLGLPEAQATIRKLTESLPAVQAEPLAKERNNILELHRTISQLNESNVVLLQQSIDIYQRILQTLAGQPPRSQTYSANGQVNIQSTVSLVSTQG